MKIDVAAVRRCLKSFDFATLFREHLGWDKHQAQLDIPVDGNTIRLTAVAQKRGFSVYVCQSIPGRRTRLKIDQQITKTAREHFVIYADQGAGQQVWQWVRREAGKPLASRDHRFDVSSTGDSLIQRLEHIAVSVDEEETFTLVQASSNVRRAFDVETVTKKFYERFKAEHAAFLKFIKGIKSQTDLEWYTSLMLNRLMFVYFIQKKGFLDGDIDYLRNRMRRVRELKGKDKFQSFYRYFLLRLFHDGLGKHKDDRKLDRELEKLLGRVPYLNGGFFEQHELENRYAEIDIPDKAFEKLFDFFDEFRWHLDERPLREGNEINPDVVGYIFEKYINQKQMGAYYTKEDITEYISKNTIIPFLFDAAQKKCPIAFKPESFLWRLLRDDPDRYIYEAVRHGVIDDDGKVIPLPREIEAGIKDVSKRDGWNRAAVAPFALPTETWREHVARRQRCLELRDRLSRGEVHAVNDLITLNLDIWQFARDAIVNSEGPELLRAFWQALAGRTPEKSNEKFEPGITVLDPTCGSGAFLFAALRILETLYSDCLQAMASFLDEPDAPPTPNEQLKALITRGENDRCEFKSSMRHCIKTAQAPIAEDKRKEVLKTKDKERNHDVLKSVAAMLNTGGGDVIVGIQDDGSPYGLEADYQYFSKESERNADGYELWLRQLLVNHFGVLNSQNVRAQFVALEGKQILWLRVSPGQSASYVTNEDKQKVLYIRNGNETRALEIEEIVAYHQTRFTPDAIKALPGPAPEPIARPTKKKRGDDFRVVLDQIRKHPSERYFILKSIIIGNLFGVDIMREAVEICKLRLFLKLVAQVERVEQIEPLPDIDFNIRAGNTLVGYVSLDEIRRAIDHAEPGVKRLVVRPEVEEDLQRLEEDALAVEKCFEQFRAQQTTHGGKVTAKDKAELRKRLGKLDAELDHYLAGEYGIDAKKAKEAVFDEWKHTHEPFHWLVEFFGIMSQGGFDVVIGNPPYVEYAKVRSTYTVRGFTTIGCGNLFALIMERSRSIASSTGRLGLIVPLSLACTDRMSDARSHLLQGTVWLPCFDIRPASLFEGVAQRLAIVVQHNEQVGARRLFTGGYRRWSVEERAHLMALTRFVDARVDDASLPIPKIACADEATILAALNRNKPITSHQSDAAKPIYVHRICRYFIKALDFVPYFKNADGIKGKSEDYKPFGFKNDARSSIVCFLNSTLFYWFWRSHGDGFHCGYGDVYQAPFPETVDRDVADRLSKLTDQLMDALKENSVLKTIRTNKGEIVYQEFSPTPTKPILDEIDGVLCRAFGLSLEFRDFIVNYDIKYRLGQDESGDDE